LAERVKELLFECAEEYGWEIIELNIQIDHVHMVVQLRPNISVSKVVKLFKTILLSAAILFSAVFTNAQEYDITPVVDVNKSYVKEYQVQEIYETLYNTLQEKLQITRTSYDLPVGPNQPAVTVYYDSQNTLYYQSDRIYNSSLILLKVTAGTDSHGQVVITQQTRTRRTLVNGSLEDTGWVTLQGAPWPCENYMGNEEGGQVAFWAYPWAGKKVYFGYTAEVHYEVDLRGYSAADSFRLETLGFPHWQWIYGVKELDLLQDSTTTYGGGIRLHIIVPTNQPTYFHEIRPRIIHIPH